jgi:hypothetical protein
LELIVQTGHTHPRGRSPRGCCTITDMPKTRDFAVLCTACLFASILAGFLLVGDNTPPQVPVVQEPVFLREPQESYEVEPYREELVSESRDVFIEKVRNAYIPTVKDTVQEEVKVSEISAPVSSTTSTISGTSLYGDTGL